MVWRPEKEVPSANLHDETCPVTFLLDNGAALALNILEMMDAHEVVKLGQMLWGREPKLGWR